MASRILFLDRVPPPASLTHLHITLACKADAAVISNPVPLQGGSMQLHAAFADEAAAAQRRPCHALTTTVFPNQVPRQVSSAHPPTAFVRKTDMAQPRACHAPTTTAVVSNPVPLQAGSMQLHTAFADEAAAAQRSATASCYALTTTVFPNQVPRQVSSMHPFTATARKADTAQPRRCHAPTATAAFSNPVPLQAGSMQIHTVFADQAAAAQRSVTVDCYALTATVFRNQVPRQASSMHPRTAFADEAAQPSAMVDCYSLTAVADGIFFPNQTSPRADSAHPPTAFVRKADMAQPRACHALNMTPLRFARQKPPVPSARGSVSDSEPRPEGVDTQLLMTLCLTVTMVFRNPHSALAAEANAVRLIEALLGEV